MSLIVAGGGEERHSNTVATLIGPWATSGGVSPDVAVKYTGAASFILKGTASGSSARSSQTAKGWWSFAALTPGWGNGTHRALWYLGTLGGGVVLLRWIKGSSNDESKIRLTTFGGGSGTSAAEFTKLQWHRIKVEFDNGVWTVWASDNGAAFAEVISYDDSGISTELALMQMSPNITSDEGKEANTLYHVDDCLLWDGAGDNWNSRIGAQDFPHISVAHMPVTPDSEGGAPEWQDLDEIPPDGVDFAGIDETDYWTTVEDFKVTDSGTADVAVSTTAGSPGTLTDTREAWGINFWRDCVVTCNGETMTITSNTATDLVGGDWSGDPGDGFAWEITCPTIQALMVTRVDEGTAPHPGPRAEYNVREGGVLSVDSADKVVQQGNSVDDRWLTYAGSYPWTPAGYSWTQALFEACQYGCTLVDGETDQITVQVIYFGTEAEWPGLAVAARRVFITHN